MHDSMTFDAPWDGKLTLVTTLVAVLLGGTVLFLIWLALTQMPSLPLRLFLLFDAAVVAGVFVATALLAPRGYAIGEKTFRIERRLGAIEIPVASIREVGPLPPESLKGTWRTLGSGGFFGYYGRFRNRTLGSFRMYATRSEGYVLVRAEHPYVLTPDSPARLIDELRRRGTKAIGAAPSSS
jgi:hypothetical protein